MTDHTNRHKCDVKPLNRHRTLRLALAMRGGVSLAVWIGGAVAEIDLFRRACNAAGTCGDIQPGAQDPPCHTPGTCGDFQLASGERPEHRDRAITYRRLFAFTRYRRVEVDILAGASAGGLNAVLYGVAQSYGRVMDEAVRRTWVDHGGMWNLLREPGFGRVKSLLKGDEQLFTVILDTLNSLADPMNEKDPQWRPPPATPVERVTVELAATLLDDVHNPQRRNRARFSFVKTPGDLTSRYTTIPGPAAAVDDDEHDSVATALNRMALAARATSSFPGAFEPAEIYATCEDDEDADAAKYREPRKVNMARAFLYSRSARTYSEPFNVVDGGIYDNIPIGRTIRAIQRSPISPPSERLLIYLDPEPPTPRQPTENAEQRSSAVSWIPVIRSSMALKQRQETAANELTEVREHNESVLRTRGRQEALAAALRGIRQAQRASGQTLTVSQIVNNDSYVQCRIAMDAERLALLLTDPWSELCRPPREAVDYTALDSSTALHIKNWLAVIYNEKAAEWALPTDLYALLDWTRLLIAWVHALENLLECLSGQSAPPPDQQTALALKLQGWKSHLYRCTTVLTEAKHQAVDTVLAGPLAFHPTINATYDLKTLKRSLTTSHRQQQSLSIPLELAQCLWTVRQSDQLTEGDDANFYTQLGKWGTAQQSGVEQPFRGFLRWVLDGVRRQIVTDSATVLAALPSTNTMPSLQTWHESVFAEFHQDPLKTLTIDSLSRLFAMTGGPAAAPMIAFDQITSDEPPAVGMERLERAARATQLETWLRRPPADNLEKERMQRVLAQPHHTLMNADAKLAGNCLSRFGGFLRGRWRENDWQWGRLDAAAALARILNDSRGDDRLSDDQLRPVVAGLQNSIRTEARESTGGGDPPIVETAGADTLEAISPHYRFALASRAVPLVCRALLPPQRSTLSVAGLAAVLSQVALRPLAVALTLLADPLRLAFAMVVITGTAALLGAGTSPEWVQWIYSIIVIVLGAFIGARAVKADRNWRQLREQLHKLDRFRPEDRIAELWTAIVVQADHRRYRLASGIVALTLVLAAGYHLFALCQGRAHLRLPAESFTIIIVGVVLLQHWLNALAYRMRAGRVTSWRRRILGWCTGVAAVLVVAVAEYSAATQDQVGRHQNPLPARGFEGPKHAVPGLLSWVSDQPLHTTIVAAAAVGLLTFISLWGWASNGWAVLSVALAALCGAGAQWILDERWAAGWRLWDLLPTAVWMLVVGLIAPKMPYRPDNYGDTDAPQLIAPAARPETAADHAPSNAAVGAHARQPSR